MACVKQYYQQYCHWKGSCPLFPLTALIPFWAYRCSLPPQMTQGLCDTALHWAHLQWMIVACLLCHMSRGSCLDFGASRACMLHTDVYCILLGIKFNLHHFIKAPLHIAPTFLIKIKRLYCFKPACDAPPWPIDIASLHMPFAPIPPQCGYNIALVILYAEVPTTCQMAVLYSCLECVCSCYSLLSPLVLMRCSSIPLLIYMLLCLAALLKCRLHG